MLEKKVCSILLDPYTLPHFTFKVNKPFGELTAKDIKHYLVQIKGNKVKVCSQTTKTIRDSYEVKQLRKVLEGFEQEKVRALYG